VPTSFSIAIDIPLAEMLEAIGHDGSQIIHHDLPEPRCRRAFHPQECLQVLDALGYAATPFEAISILQVDDQHQIELNWTHDFENHLHDCDGVIMGQGLNNRHAVAWVNQTVFDPNGYTYDYTDLVGMIERRVFIPQTLWKIKSFAK
jgi:hypothetical protein